MDPSKNIRCICKVQSSPHQNLSMNQLGPVIEILKKKKKAQLRNIISASQQSLGWNDA